MRMPIVKREHIAELDSLLVPIPTDLETLISNTNKLMMYIKNDNPYLYGVITQIFSDNEASVSHACYFILHKAAGKSLPFVKPDVFNKILGRYTDSKELINKLREIQKSNLEYSAFLLQIAASFEVSAGKKGFDAAFLQGAVIYSSIEEALKA